VYWHDVARDYDGEGDAIINGNGSWLFTEELLQECLLEIRNGMNFGKFVQTKLTSWACYSQHLPHHTKLATLNERHLGFDGLSRSTYFLRVFMGAVFDFIELQRRGGLDYTVIASLHPASLNPPPQPPPLSQYAPRPPLLALSWAEFLGCGVAGRLHMPVRSGMRSAVR
jgi:hypothetical protein